MKPYFSHFNAYQYVRLYFKMTNTYQASESTTRSVWWNSEACFRQCYVKVRFNVAHKMVCNQDISISGGEYLVDCVIIIKILNYCNLYKTTNLYVCINKNMHVYTNWRNPDKMRTKELCMDEKCFHDMKEISASIQKKVYGVKY